MKARANFLIANDGDLMEAIHERCMEVQFAGSRNESDSDDEKDHIHGLLDELERVLQA